MNYAVVCTLLLSGHLVSLQGLERRELSADTSAVYFAKIGQMVAINMNNCSYTRAQVAKFNALNSTLTAAEQHDFSIYSARPVPGFGKISHFLRNVK